MKHFRSNKAIGYLFAVSSILLAVASFTISNSFAFSDDKDGAMKFNTYFGEVVSTNNNGRAVLKNDRIDINVTLNSSDNNYTATTSIINDGQFDARLSRFDVTDLRNIKVGTSSRTGTTYYLSDYVNISVKYAQDNSVNEITEGSNVSIGDTIRKKTQNDIIVTIQYKDRLELSEDAIRVLNEGVSTITGNNSLKFTVSIKTNFAELK